MKDLAVKKHYQGAYLSIAKYLAPDHLIFLLKCSEMILINSPL